MPEDSNTAVIAAHLEHLSKDMTEMKQDLKAMPEKMAVLYVPKEEFSQFKSDFVEMRGDLRKLSEKMDTRDAQFVTKEEMEKQHYVTRDQFAPLRNGAYAVVGIILSEIIGFLFWILQKHFN